MESINEPASSGAPGNLKGALSLMKKLNRKGIEQQRSDHVGQTNQRG